MRRTEAGARLRLCEANVQARSRASAAIFAFLLTRLYCAGVGSEAVGSEAAGRVVQLETVRLDPRHVEWRQLALIPSVGPAIARRVVRALRSSSGTDASLRDRLERVRGVGPRLLEVLLAQFEVPDRAGGAAHSGR